MFLLVVLYPTTRAFKKSGCQPRKASAGALSFQPTSSLILNEAVSEACQVNIYLPHRAPDFSG